MLICSTKRHVNKTKIIKFIMNTLFCYPDIQFSEASTFFLLQS